MSHNIKSPVLLVFLALTIIVGIRWFMGGKDFTYFAVIGSEFSSHSKHYFIHDGPGYDGQFFLRHALDPSGKADVGIQVDHPAYRHQRILYPVLAWILGFGNKDLIPMYLVLINMLCLALSAFFIARLCAENGISQSWSLFVLGFSGLLMALARDLAEPMECLFLILTFYAFSKERFPQAALWVLACVFTRESSAILLLPACIYHGLNLWRIGRIGTAFSLSLPFLAYASWKYGLFIYHGSGLLVEGGGNFTWPLLGLFEGFQHQYINIESPMGWIELVVSLAYLCWNAWLIGYAIKSFKAVGESLKKTGLLWSILSGAFIALFFSHSIFDDDWSFNRVLSGLAVLSFLALIIQKRMPGKIFVLYTIGMASFTILRVWIRP